MTTFAIGRGVFFGDRHSDEQLRHIVRLALDIALEEFGTEDKTLRFLFPFESPE